MFKFHCCNWLSGYFYINLGIVKIKFFQVNENALNGDHFYEFYKELIEEVNEEKILILDNSNNHHTQNVHLLNRFKIQKHIYLPPFSPDFNPIEMFFHVNIYYIIQTWKTVVRKSKNFKNNLFKNIVDSLDLIKATDYKNYIKRNNIYNVYD